MPGLGKGLSSLIPDNLKKKVGDSAVQAVPVTPSKPISVSSPVQVKSEIVTSALPVGEAVVQLPVDKIKSNRYQPRQHFGHAEIEELASSIKAHGILQPLVVTPSDSGTYELIAGERRLRAAKILDMATVPAIVRQAADQQRLELALIENIQRQDLNVVEEAQSYSQLVDEFNLTHDQVAERVGKSRSAVTNAMRILSLPEAIRTAVVQGKITAGHARSIASLNTAEDQMDLFQKIVSQHLNVREVEKQAKKLVVAKHLRRVKFDPILDDMTDSLRTALGTKVNIKKHGEEGTIMINFYSEEELNNLVKKITEV